jgi:anthranilate phosphoribosyltransferase
MNIIDVKLLMKQHVSLNVPVPYGQAYALGRHAIAGCRGDSLAQVQSIALLCALHNQALYAWKGDSTKEAMLGRKLPTSAAEQIAGVCAAIFDLDIATSDFGFVSPNVPFAMDNCGMGGDFVVTANVSSIAAFIAAAGGIAMCKHGSPANADSGKYGSSDFLSLVCGIDVFSSREETEHSIDAFGFGYTEALDTRYKRIHLQTHQIAHMPHMNDIIGPITSPLLPTKLRRRVLGVNHLIPPRVIAEAYQILNEKKITHLEHGIFIRGFADRNRLAGMDELSICEGGTQVVELKYGEITEYTLHAKDFGLADVRVEDISPRGNKGQFSLGILKGEIGGPPLQMVLANAALLFYLDKRSTDLRECYCMAEKVFADGGAFATMKKIQNAFPVKKIP